MSQQVINVGAAPNDGLGDPIRTSFIKCNDNFGELYSRAQTQPPPTLIGQIGDEAGMYAYDSSFFYYCFANYDGSSVIWAQVAQIGNVILSQIASGNSSVGFASSGGPTVITVGGVANTAVFSNSGVELTGAVTSASFSATGNITGGNLVVASRISAGGNITGSNILTAGQVSATGNVTGNYILGNGALLTGIVTNVTNVINGASNVNIASANADVTIGVNAVSNVAVFTTTGANITGTLNVTSNVLSGGVVSATGNLFGTNLVAGGSITATGNIAGGNVNTAGVISAAGNIVTAGFFVGNFAGNIVANILVPGSNTQVLFNTNGNADAVAGLTYNTASNTLAVLGVVTAAGNVVAGNINSQNNVSAVGNVFSGANISAAGTVLGNIVSANSVSANSYSGNSINVNDNVTGGNITTVGQVTATGNVTGGNIVTSGQVVGAQISSTGNVTAVNIVASGVITSTGNITGGNINSTGRITSTGNITGGNILTAGTISAVGFVRTAANIIAIGDITGGNIYTNNNINGDALSGNSLSINSIVANIVFTDSFDANVATITDLVVGNIENGLGNGVGNIGSSTAYFDTVFAVTTTATQADLAEKYTADADYEPGTVVSFGGEKEITISMVDQDPTVAGVVSSRPAYIMNSTLESEHVATVALVGRVPCRVQGVVKKGSMMVSAGNGLARAELSPAMGTVIGKALESFDGETGTIEIVVGRF